jgi:GTPase
VSDPYTEALGDTLIERTRRERIVLVGVTLPPAGDEDTDASLDELALLVDTAGADVVDRLVQRRARPDPSTFIGKGKAAELKDVCLAVDADTVVFDNELSPAQQYNLERLLGRTAIDRTAVILDIFAQNAHTPEGKAQVELAMLQYRLPRVRRGKSAQFTQQAGGAGAGLGARRGPGETKLEVDRRRITRRISKLEVDLRELQQTRQLQRRSRVRSGLANVTIVGYTNAGKSTLLNRLTRAGVLVEDRLFATLDPTTRRLALPGGEPVLLTDTVGFVRRLPHGLVEAFQSTLESVGEADLLIHIVDASSPDPQGQIDAVRAVLGEIGAAEVPELLVFNKADLARGEAKRLAAAQEGSVAISATTGEGLDRLLAVVGDRLRSASGVVELLVPFDRGDVLAMVHREGEVLCSTNEEGGIRLRARLDGASRGRLESYVIEAPALHGVAPR